MNEVARRQEQHTESNDYQKDVIDLFTPPSKENYKEGSTGEDKKDSSKKELPRVSEPVTGPPSTSIVKDDSQQKKEFAVSQNMFVLTNSEKRAVTDTYEIKEMLGQGGFGKVYKVVHRATGMVRALKLIPKSKLPKEGEVKLLEETAILGQMDHPNIVKLFEVFSDENSYCLISQYCEGGELFEKIRNTTQLTEKTIAVYLKQILSAVMYCHKKGIVHRDLKPENILFDSKANDSALQIIDFGASAKLLTSTDKLQKRIGTPFYVAPEVLAANYNQKCDIWSCGVILYILLCGYPPFFGKNEMEVLQKVKKAKDWAKVSIQAKDLIRRMLFYDPEERISAEEAYNHPWIQHNNTKGQLQNTVLTNLTGFQMQNKVKHAILEFISVQVMTNFEKEELRKNFEQLDRNGDGMVSKEELFSAYKKLYNDKIIAHQIVNDLFANMDANGSGKVDFSEFVAAAIDRQRVLSRKKIEQSFKLFDLDGNGYITRNEVQELFGEGGNVNEQLWSDILQECDKNGDGMISLSEFIELLEKKLSSDRNEKSIQQ